MMEDVSFGARLAWFFGGLVLGAIYLFLSLPQGIEALAGRKGWSWAAGPARWTDTHLNSVLPPFSGLWAVLIGATVVYLLALIVLSARHRSAGLIGVAVPTLAVTTCVVPLLAWLSFLLLHVELFLGHLLAYVLDPAVDPWAWVTLSVIAIIWVVRLVRAMLIVYDAGWDVFVYFVRSMVLTVLVTGIGVGIGFLLHFFASFLLVVQVVIFCVVMCSVAGQLIIDQLRGALLAGNDLLGVVLGAMSIGSAFSTLMLVSDSFGVYGIYPAPVAHWARQYAFDSAGPRLDALIALAAVVLSIVGVVRNLAALREPPEWEEFQKSMVFQVVGVSMAVFIPAVNDQLRTGRYQ
jgi:hypothetical protein